MVKEGTTRRERPEDETGIFHFPLRLGRYTASLETPLGSKLWIGQEGSERRALLEPLGETELERRLFHHGPEDGVVLVTGEPGAGKSSLLSHWITNWHARTPKPRLGSPVPILVPLRMVANDLGQAIGEALADTLWQTTRGVAHGRLGVHPLAAFPGLRPWWPLWLLDGVDELAPSLLDQNLLARLAGLPGRVVVTCRTAVAVSLRPQLATFVRPRDWLEILPLTADEQRRFLDRRLAPMQAEALWRALVDDPELATLTQTPLMLEFAAMLGRSDLDGGNRARFLEAAVRELWVRRLDLARAQSLRAGRERVLETLAATMRLDRIRTPAEALDEALATAGSDVGVLQEALLQSGLVRLMNEQVEFLHLTLQEFYLARALTRMPLEHVLDQHWADARFDETLALVLARTAAERGLDLVDRTLTALQQCWLDRHRENPARLRTLGRSPMRTFLELVARGGLPFAGLTELARGWNGWLDCPDPDCACRAPPPVGPRKFGLMRQSSAEQQLAGAIGCRSARLQAALASTGRLPSELQDRLANSPLVAIRRSLTENPMTRAGVVLRLAEDPDSRVRRLAIWHPAMPFDRIVEGAREGRRAMEEVVAWHPLSPPDLLVELYRRTPARGFRSRINAYASVRVYVAGNPSAPAALLLEAAQDENREVRNAVIRNPNTPRHVLLTMARGDANHHIRTEALVASDPPAPVLEAMLDADPESSRVVAEKAVAGPYLYQAAKHPQTSVRRALANRTDLPEGIVELLLEEDDLGIRHDLAANPALPPALAERIFERAATASDAYESELVLRELAHNPATPLRVLAALATNRNSNIWWRLARNRSAPGEVLEDLATTAGPDRDTLRGLAGNVSSPTTLLARLYQLDRPRVVELAGNPSMLLEDLFDDPASVITP